MFSLLAFKALLQVLMDISPYLSKVNQVSKKKPDVRNCQNCLELESPAFKLYSFLSTSGYIANFLGCSSQLTTPC